MKKQTSSILCVSIAIIFVSICALAFLNESQKAQKDAGQALESGKAATEMAGKLDKIINE